MRLERISAGRYRAVGEPFSIVSIGGGWFVISDDGPVVCGPFDTKRATAAWLAGMILDRRTVA